MDGAEIKKPGNKIFVSQPLHPQIILDIFVPKKHFSTHECICALKNLLEKGAR